MLAVPIRVPPTRYVDGYNNDGYNNKDKWAAWKFHCAKPHLEN